MNNQQVSITQKELDKLKNIPEVTFNLPLNEQAYSTFVKLVGLPKIRLRKQGVYIFTHKATGSKYIGSSYSLSRTLFHYLNSLHFNQKDTGLIIPLIKKEGFSAFSLEIKVMPDEFDSGYSFLFLEQYFLLHSSFDLNLQRIVNFRVKQGRTIYLYNLDGSLLYYKTASLSQIRDNLGIHNNTCMKGIKNSESYLNFFKITDTPFKKAKKANLNLPHLSSLILEKKALFLINSFSAKISLPVFLKEIVSGKFF